MYNVIYLNKSGEKVTFTCYSMEEVLSLGRQYSLSLVLDEANNIITGEVLRELKATA